jgi:tRNA threonylcarbamoyladenosine biosynthesis protein TsaE
MTTILSRSPQETVDLGRSFATSLSVGDVVAIFGNLGTGKTLFVKGVCAGLGVHEHVASPTFTIISEHPAPCGKVIHIDLYRVSGHTDLRELGLEEYFGGNNICLIEWAERVLELLPPQYYRVKVSFGKGETDREFLIEQAGGRL